jgi:hypothetical protein
MADPIYSADDYGTPSIPPATPPALDGHASAHDAATLTDADGDSDSPGSVLWDFNRSEEDEELQPGATPDEVVPDVPNPIEPAPPPEVYPDGGDIDEPGSVPDDVPTLPDQAPAETPPPQY